MTKGPIFLSYQAGDARVARAIQSAMTKRGLQVFDPVNVAPGENFAEALKRELKQASVLLVLASPDEVSSWQLFEVGMADALGKPVVVVGSRAGSNEVQPELRDKPMLRLSPTDSAGIEAIVDKIRDLAVAA